MLRRLLVLVGCKEVGHYLPKGVVQLVVHVRVCSKHDIDNYTARLLVLSSGEPFKNIARTVLQQLHRLDNVVVLQDRLIVEADRDR